MIVDLSAGMSLRSSRVPKKSASLQVLSKGKTCFCDILNEDLNEDSLSSLTASPNVGAVGLFLLDFDLFIAHGRVGRGLTLLRPSLDEAADSSSLS